MLETSPLRSMPSPVCLLSLAAALLAGGPVVLGAEEVVRDGRLFDPGIGREAPAESAPSELARLLPLLGDWEVVQEIQGPNGTLRGEGRARWTFLNRGHAVLERVRIPDFDGAGNAMATMAFVDVDPQGVWSVGEGNSWTESISLYSGGFATDASAEDGEGTLVVHDAMRPGGGPVLILKRRTYRTLGDDRFEMVQEVSTDLGDSWGPNVRREYRRVEDARDEFFPVRDDVGLPSPDRAPEAAEFDFLLGEFDASHWLSPPSGPPARWASEATAVHALDGKAILEFDAFSNPGLEDGATSILRIYNTAMRQWESLFLPNRSHRPLHFGGVREDDRIVLHLFDATTGPGSVHQWIFFDVREDSYRWKGQSSPDRGRTFALGWAIDFVRRGVELPEAEVTPVDVRSAGVLLVGDHYRAAQPAAPTVVLFHQAGGDARGELAPIARRLQAEGFEVFAWDVRGGGDRFGETNRTVAGLDAPFDGGYCDAYPDLEAALRASWRAGSGGPMTVVGSSYSAALVVRLAAEEGALLAGAAAFSPASSRMDDCAVETWLPEVGDVPLLAFRPTAELEVESVAAQRDLLTGAGVEVFVADGSHGASLLVPERSDGAERAWERFRAFLDDPRAPAVSDD